MFDRLARRSAASLLLLLSPAASAQVSRLYITTSSGIDVYNVASTGKLTLISGSPFKGTSGLAIGTAGNHFVTVGSTYIRSYGLHRPAGSEAKFRRLIPRSITRANAALRQEAQSITRDRRYMSRQPLRDGIPLVRRLQCPPDLQD